MAQTSYNGPKLRGSHHDYIDAAKPVIKRADREPSIVGIHFGKIENRRTSRPSISFTESGRDQLQAEIRGNTSSQTIVLYTTNRARMKAALEEAFGSK